MYVEIVFDLPIDTTFTYKVPLKFEIYINMYERVVVSLRGDKLVGLIINIYDKKPQLQKPIKYREIIRLIDKESILNDEQVVLSYFLVKYYFCSLGEALFRMLPSGRRNVPLLPSKVLEPKIANKLLPKLNVEQEQIINKILHIQDIRVHPHLIFGITGSGKTRIYIDLISHYLKKKEGVILLIPEIALSYQFYDLFKNLFVDKNQNSLVAYLHSNINNATKFMEYKKLQKKEKLLVIGTRSAIFAPVHALSLIIIDEEHDSSYKENLSPKYNTKNIALKRLQYNTSQYNKTTHLILGSATPSVETYSLAKNKQFSLHRLKKRATSQKLPKIIIVEHQIAYEKTAILSSHLIQKMNVHIKNDKQVLLLLNRRGYHHFAFCSKCKQSKTCINCSVSLKYHKGVVSNLKCHLCGYSEIFIPKCNKCNSSFELIGKGIQQVEDALDYFFPKIPYARLDQDTSKEKGYVEDVLQAMNHKKIQILIGTQMIAKGFDLEHVTLVGILNTDIGLELPDFRASERTAQLLIQAAGRAGRHHNGEVIMQTMQPNHDVLQYTLKYQYEEFLNREIILREQLMFPPFCYLLRILFTYADLKTLKRYSLEVEEFIKYNFIQEDLFSLLEDTVPNNKKYLEIMGPLPSTIEKLKGEFRYHLIIKSKNQEKIQDIGQQLKKHLRKKSQIDGVRYIFDYNPLDLL